MADQREVSRRHVVRIEADAIEIVRREIPRRRLIPSNARYRRGIWKVHQGEELPLVHEGYPLRYESRRSRHGLGYHHGSDRLVGRHLGV